MPSWGSATHVGQVGANTTRFETSVWRIDHGEKSSGYGLGRHVGLPTGQSATLATSPLARSQRNSFGMEVSSAIRRFFKK